MTPQFKNRLALISIAFLFIGPFIAAWWIKDDPTLLGVSETKNYGELFAPARAVELAAFTEAGDPQALDVAGRWVMLHLDTDGICDSVCEESLYAMKQVHVLLNKDAQRMQRRLIFLGDVAKPTESSRQDTALKVLTWTPEQVSALEEKLEQPITDGMILLMDPLGNIVLRYPVDFDPYGVQSDLRLLFKASQVG